MATEQRQLHRTVYARTPQEWINENSDSGKDRTVHGSREEAIQVAEQMIRAGGGGVLTVENAEGVEDRRPILVSGTRTSLDQGSDAQAGSRTRDATAHDERAMSDPVRGNVKSVSNGTDKSRTRQR